MDADRVGMTLLVFVLVILSLPLIFSLPGEFLFTNVDNVSSTHFGIENGKPILWETRFVLNGTPHTIYSESPSVQMDELLINTSTGWELYATIISSGYYDNITIVHTVPPFTSLESDVPIKKINKTHVQTTLTFNQSMTYVIKATSLIKRAITTTQDGVFEVEAQSFITDFWVRDNNVSLLIENYSGPVSMSVPFVFEPSFYYLLPFSYTLDEKLHFNYSVSNFSIPKPWPVTVEKKEQTALSFLNKTVHITSNQSEIKTVKYAHPQFFNVTFPYGMQFIELQNLTTAIPKIRFSYDKPILNSSIRDMNVSFWTFNGEYHRLPIEIINDTTLDFFAIDGGKDELVQDIDGKVSIIGGIGFSPKQTIYDPITENVSIQYNATIGEPVKWKRQIKLTSSQVTDIIPSQATNISVIEIFANQRRESNVKISNGNSLVESFKRGISNQALLENETLLDITSYATSLEITYETPAPKAKQTRLSNIEQEVIVSSDVHYENVSSYATIAEGEEVVVYWMKNNSPIKMDIWYSDSNENGLFDTVHWIAPHLSTQVFKIILVSEAYELDENGIAVRDIYDFIKARDNNWVTIPESHKVRVTFEKPLENGNDITFVARGNATVSIYADNNKLGEVLVTEGLYRFFPQNISNQSIFDLIADGEIEYDYIVDPQLFSYYDPTSDINAGWGCTGTNCTPGDFGVLNDSIYRPSNPRTATDYLSQNSNSGAIGEFAFPAITESSIEYIRLWSYIQTGSNHQMTITLLNQSGIENSTVITPNTPSQWRSVTWNNPTTVGTISARYASVKSGSGGPSAGFIYANYIEVGFNDFVTPNIAYIPFSETNNTILNYNYIASTISASDSGSGLKNITVRLYNAGSLDTQTDCVSSPCSANFTSLSDGTYQLNATAFDIVNNSASVLTRNFTVDNTAPIINFVSLTPSNASNLSQNWIYANVTVQDTFLKNTSVYLYNATSNLLLQRSSFVGNVSFNFTNLGDDTYILNASVIDIANTTSITESRIISLDTVSPLISYVPLTQQNLQNFTLDYFYLNVSVTEANLKNLTAFLYRDGILVNTTSLLTFPYFINYTSMQSGTYTFNVTVYDYADNFNSTQSHTFITDTVSPSIIVQSPVQGNTYITNPLLVNVTTSDENGIFQTWYNNGTNNNTYSAPINITLSTANYTFTFYANDTFGNLRSQEINFTFDAGSIDMDPPTITINDPLNITYNTTNIPLYFTATDNVAVNETWYNNGTTNLSFSGSTFVTVGQGQYTFIMYANDSTGNVGMENVTFFVDSVYPVISYIPITQTDNTYISRNYIYVNISQSELNPRNITTRLYQGSSIVGQQSSSSNTLFSNFTSISDGVYTFNSTTNDIANNTDSTTIRTITVDTLIPHIGFVNPTLDNSSNSSQNYLLVNVSTSDTNFANTTIYLYDSSQLILNVTSTERNFSYNFSSLSDEIYFFNATSTDLAGNSNKSVTRTVTLDTTNPIITLVSPTESNNAILNQTYIAINATVSDINYKNITFILDGPGAYFNQTWNSSQPAFFNFTNLEDGSYILSASAYDYAQNVQSTTSRAITIKTTIQTAFDSEYHPYSDIQTGWTCTGCSGTQSEVLNDSTLEPDDPTLTNYITQTATAGGISEHNLTTITEPAVNDITFWVYAQTGANHRLNVTVENNGVYITSRVINPGSSANWFPLVWDVPSPPGDVSLVFTSSRQGGGGGDPGFIYAWYASVNYNDTTAPEINYESSTQSNFSNITVNQFNVNVTANDSESLLNSITTYVYNSTLQLVASNTLVTSPNDFDYTGLEQGVHYFNASAVDYAGNVNILPTREIFIDTFNPNISFDSSTEQNNSNRSIDWFIANVTVFDQFLRNATLDLYDDSQVLLNRTSSVSSLVVNFTSLSDGIYYYNATAIDGHNQTNQTVQRKITIDTNVPSITYVPLTEQNSSLFSKSYLQINVTAIDLNLRNTTIYLYNETELINTSMGLTIVSANFTNLADGIYFFNATTSDYASNENSTPTYTVQIDTIAPVLNVYSPVINETYTSQTLLNFSATDLNGVDSLWYFNGTDNVTYTIPQNITLANDTYTFIFYANDSVGNLVSQSITFNFEMYAFESIPGDIILVLAENSSILVNETLQNGLKQVLVGSLDRNYSALLWVNFSADINVSSLISNVSVDSTKSVIHNFNDPSIKNVSLLIPRKYQSGEVVICPGATSLDEVTPVCAGNVNLGLGYWQSNMFSQLITIDSREYYEVQNISGTGGFESVIDLQLAQINFSPSTVIEGENLTVRLNVTNIGNGTARNWRAIINITKYNGSYIYDSNYTSDFFNLSYNTSMNITFNWTASIGTHSYDVFLDWDEVVNETNETNNIVSQNYSTSSWTIIYGNYTFDMLLGESSDALKGWVPTGLSGNLFYSDVDASYIPPDLLGLNGAADLFQADQALHSLYFEDSLQNTFDTDNNGIADNFINITIGSNPVMNVPIVNSTSANSFYTGLLYDASDGIGYDGTQDLVIVTFLNQSQMGLEGMYDYEVRIPATLDTLVPATESITRFDEVN